MMASQVDVLRMTLRSAITRRSSAIPKEDVAGAKPAVIGLAADRGGGPPSCSASTLGGKTAAASTLGGKTARSSGERSVLGGCTVRQAPSTLGGLSAVDCRWPWT